MEHILYWLWITEKLTFSKIKAIRGITKNIEDIYGCTDFSVYPFLDKKDISSLLNKDLSSAKKMYALCTKNGIRIIVWDSPGYPPLLRYISVPPLILYAKGTIPNWNDIFVVGIVGTRTMTKYGENITHAIARDLIKEGVTIVTGFAKGNDTAASEIAILNGAFSIAVLGCGLDVIYPPENEELYNIICKNGLLLSEFPPETPPIKRNFPRRNRIIAGLSKAILVTEAPKKSGALITASFALDEGRDIYAVPGPVDSKNSVGTNKLIQEGAKAVLTAEDIICEYSVFEARKHTHKANEVKLAKSTKAENPKRSKKQVSSAPKQKKEAQKTVPEFPSGIDGEILKCIFEGDKNIDDLCAEIGKSLTECNSACFMLELSGRIKRLPGNVYTFVK